MGIKKIRQYSGHSQEWLAKKAGVNQSYLSQLENGKKEPSMALLKKIAKAFKLPVNVLAYAGTEEKDVAADKKYLYTQLKPIMDSLIETVVTKGKNTKFE